MSYVRGLLPDHPSLERLSFNRPESADAFYTVSSDFEKIASKRKSHTLPTSARFGPTGYEKVTFTPAPAATQALVSILLLFMRLVQGLGSPGPGQYTPPVTTIRSSPRPSSSGGKGRSPIPSSSPAASRLAFVQTEGADSFYSSKGDFEKLAATVKSATAAKTQRFGPTGYEKGGESPGPGSYRLNLSSFRPSPNKPLAARAPAASSSSPGGAERLRFQPTEGADSFYDVVKIGGGEGSHEKKFPQKTMSRTPRFSKTGYEMGLESPGPGNYSAEKSRIVNPQIAVQAERSARAAAASASSSGNSGGKPSDGRLTFSRTEGADSFYNVNDPNQSSSPHKSAPSFSKTPKFSLTGYEKGLGTPGPGNYQPPSSPKTSKTVVPSAAFALPHFWSSSQDWAASPAAKQHSSTMLGSPGVGSPGAHAGSS